MERRILFFSWRVRSRRTKILCYCRASLNWFTVQKIAQTPRLQLRSAAQLCFAISRRGKGNSVRTQVGIVGAAPAGLTLAHMLHLEGIESVVLESRSREYVEQRVRAGVLEQGTVDLLTQSGVGKRLAEQGLVHNGISLGFSGQRKRIDFAELTGGKSITIYAQHEVLKDLIAARMAYYGALFFEAEGVSVRGIDKNPVVQFGSGGEMRSLACDFVAGCDGFHGMCRLAMPTAVLKIHERESPFAWLGILADVAPASEELIYTYHERGFALLSMRSPRVSRLYLPVSGALNTDQ